MPVLDREALDSTGFATVTDVLSAAELETLRAAVDRVVDRCAGSMDRDRWLALVNQVRSPEQWDPTFGETRVDPRLRALAAHALGSPASVAWQHLVFRAPQCALHLPWHVDLDTWPEPARSLGGVALWVALDDAGPRAAGIRYAPGSHRGLTSPPPQPVCPTVSSGSVLVHHAGILHCSGPNQTDGWRRALVLVFTPESSVA